MASNDLNIGTRLKRARREQHIHLAQAATDLCISKQYLKAFEANDLKALPEPIYAVGFMRTYAEYLKLPPGPFVDTLKSRFNAPDRPTPDHFKRQSQATTLGILLFLVFVGGIGFFGLKTVAEPSYETPGAEEIPAHVADLLDDTLEDEADAESTSDD